MLGDNAMKRNLLIGLLTVLFLGGLWACEDELTSRQKYEEYKRNHPSASQVGAFISDISPDNRTLLIGYGSPYRMNIATYNMETGDVKIFDGGENKMNFAPCFSRDGKRIAYIGAREQGSACNLFVMNADGSDRRQVTRNPATGLEDTVYVLVPSLSPDGKRIIFLRSERVRERAFPLKGEMNCDWDVYEVDVDTGVERRLTYYRFYKALSPHYLADGKRFVFTGEGPYNPQGPGPRNYKEYEDLYGQNFIFIMDGVTNELKPAFVNGSNSQYVSVAADDSILFLSRTTGMDGLPPSRDTQDLFLFQNGSIKRLTRLNACIGWSLLSKDGSTVLFLKRSDCKSREFSYWMMKSDGTDVKKIVFPAELLKR
jgi:hypothetical protein